MGRRFGHRSAGRYAPGTLTRHTVRKSDQQPGPLGPGFYMGGITTTRWVMVHRAAFRRVGAARYLGIVTISRDSKSIIAYLTVIGTSTKLSVIVRALTVLATTKSARLIPSPSPNLDVLSIVITPAFT